MKQPRIDLFYIAFHTAINHIISIKYYIRALNHSTLTSIGISQHTVLWQLEMCADFGAIYAENVDFQDDTL